MRIFSVVVLSLFALIFSQPQGAFAQAQKAKPAAAAKKKEAPVAAESSAMPASSSDYRRNAVSLELLGRGGLYSFNYDYGFHEKVSAGIGLSYYGIDSIGIFLLPVYANFYPLESLENRLMLSVGVTPVIASGTWTSSLVEKSGIGVPIGIGYEHRSSNGFLFRASPYFYIGNISGIWIGLSGGYAF